LEINAQTGPDGHVVVELLDAAGEPIDGFGPSQPVSGDDLRHVVPFEGDVASLAGRPIVVRFHLKNARLYSFAFRKP
jgi:hypothetical protein